MADPLPTGDVYADGDALADVLILASNARDEVRKLGGWCPDCQRVEHGPLCVRGRLLAWAERLSGDAEERAT